MAEIDCDKLPTKRKRDICRGKDDAGNPVKISEKEREKWMRYWRGESPDPEPPRRKKTPYQKSPQQKPQHGVGDLGVGTSLKKILKEKYKITAKPGCSCNTHANLMNQNGIDWCEENQETIVGWLMEEGTARIWLKPLVKAFPRKMRRMAQDLVSEAIKEARKQQASLLVWQYGITTIPERKESLKNTLLSLVSAGFGNPRLFVDGAKNANPYEAEFGLDVTVRNPPLKTVGNWVLSLWELYVRDAFADRYAIFQDDIIACRNLRSYLEQSKYPERSYLNLFTYRDNESLVTSDSRGKWIPSVERRYGKNICQAGRGALALVFSNEATRALLSQQSLINKPRTPEVNRRTQKIDGGIATAMKQAGFREHVHNPSLVQHTGLKSSIGNHNQPLALSFPGEGFNALDLI